ncbi:MAG: MFS transporter [Planctomycetes bacterium]|nr:MFS transporter [Planctomycetota bacterium]
MHEETQAASATNVRWWILLLLMGFTFLGHFNRVGISVAGTEKFIGEGKLSEEQMGWVYSTFLFVYTAFMLPGGWLIDRVGPRWSLTIMGLGMGFFVSLTGVLGFLGFPIAQLMIPLMLIRGVAGGFSAPLHPGTSRSVALWLPLQSRLTGNGLVTAGALIGVALTRPGFGQLMDWIDWPLAFILSGGTLMLYSVVWNVVSSDRPDGHSRVNDAEKSLIGSQTAHMDASVSIGDVFQMFGNRNLVLVTFSYAAYGYFQYLFFYWIDYYFLETLKLPKDESRIATFTVMLAMGFGMAMGGWISKQVCHRFGFRKGCRVIAIIGMTVSAVFAWLGVTATRPNLIVLDFSIALALLGMCEGVFWTSASALGGHRGGLAGAFLNTTGNIGGMIAPALTPWIGKHYGWSPAIIVACVISAVGGLLWIIIDAEHTDDASSFSS